jgi:hypothetical protein
MPDAVAEPLVYQSSSYRLASLGAGVFLATLGLAIAVFTSSADVPLGGRFLFIDVACTVLFSGWMLLGARTRVSVGAGQVQVRTKTRDGRFDVADVEGFDCRPAMLGGMSLGSQYLYVLRRTDRPLNSWSPAPGPVERAKVLAQLNARLRDEQAAAPAPELSPEATS